MKKNQSSNKNEVYYNLILKIADIFDIDALSIINTHGEILRQFKPSAVTPKKMRKEAFLYNYIKQHINNDNKFIMNDAGMAKVLNVSSITMFRWRKLLKDRGLIDYKVKFINGQKCSEITLLA